MGVQILPEESSVWGRLGRGLGEGFSTQMPKVIDRLDKERQESRLSSGLLKLAESEETNPLKQLAQLSSIPGGMAHAATILPFLQQQAARKEGQRQAGFEIPSQGAPISGSAVSDRPDIPKQRLVGSTEAFQQRGAELSSQFPILYPTAKEGALEAKSQYDLQNANIKDFGDQFDKLSGDLLHEGGPTYKHVLGKFYDKLREAGEEKSILGKNTGQQIAREYSPIVNEFAKKIYGLTEMKAGWPGFKTGDAKERGRSVASIVTSMQKMGLPLRDMQDYIEGKLGVSRGAAALMANPISPSSEEGKYLNSVKGKRGGLPTGKWAKPEDIVKNGKLKGSINGIAYFIHQHSGNAKPFIDYVRNEYKSGNLNLTESQAIELEKPIDGAADIADFLYNAFGELQ